MFAPEFVSIPKLRLKKKEQAAELQLLPQLKFAFDILTVSLQGKYTILANVVTKDDDKITCLTATVHFGR